jgi:hypothetical protein
MLRTLGFAALAFTACGPAYAGVAALDDPMATQCAIGIQVVTGYSKKIGFGGATKGGDLVNGWIEMKVRLDGPVRVAECRFLNADIETLSIDGAEIFKHP